MEFGKWIVIQQSKETINPMLLDFLLRNPWIYDMFDDTDMWEVVGCVLDMIPENRIMKADAWELYSHVVVAMNCFKKHDRVGRLLIEYLKENIQIIKKESRYITNDDILDLRIILETSKGVNDFLDHI